ncbi:hypothetical protein C8Q77DRAFT_1074818 [Trametes polyzona]|nr:hypothetical protein C8Q77DRAFT_1074818 [Trametes polyzona]
MHFPTVIKLVLAALSIGAATAAAAPSPNPAGALEDRQLGRCLLRPCKSNADCEGCNGLACGYLTGPFDAPAEADAYHGLNLTSPGKIARRHNAIVASTTDLTRHSVHSEASSTSDRAPSPCEARYAY